MNMIKQKSVQLLIDQFWKQGYLTISRRFGTYLPEPGRVGEFEVDIIARCKNNYAIGITLGDEDLKDGSTLERITYLASRQTRNTNRKVTLFIGTSSEHLKQTRLMVGSLSPDLRNNIRIFQIKEKVPVNRLARSNKTVPLFS